MTCAIYFHCINPRAHSLIFKTRESERDTQVARRFIYPPRCVSFSYSEAVVGTLQIKSRLTLYIYILLSNAADIASLAVRVCISLYVCMCTYIQTRFTFYMEVTKYAHKLLYHFLNRGKILSLIYVPAPRNQPFNKLDRRDLSLFLSLFLSWQAHLTIDIQNIHGIHYAPCSMWCTAWLNELCCAICILLALCWWRKNDEISQTLFLQIILLINYYFLFYWAKWAHIKMIAWLSASLDVVKNKNTITPYDSFGNYNIKCSF